MRSVVNREGLELLIQQVLFHVQRVPQISRPLSPSGRTEKSTFLFIVNKSQKYC
jgi:hypothetical protein